MKNRIENLQKILERKNVFGILVTNPVNIFYLTGFIGLAPQERESSLLVTINKAYLFIPVMYEARAKNSAASNINLIAQKERGELLFGFIEYMPKKSVILFEENDLRVAELDEIEKKFSGKLKSAGNIIEKLRLTKDAREIAKIRYAVELTDKTFLELTKYVRARDYTKFSEYDLAEKIRQIAKSLGANGLGFDSIVASGAGSAEPHYFTSEKKLKSGEVLLIDMGIKYQGYSGDLTRCIFLGRANRKVKNIYQKVLEANLIGIKHAKTGISGHDLYHKANNFFKSYELSEKFTHGLGHGIGLEIHEEPYLRSNMDLELACGMTATIEPGLYFTGEFGIRIEDLAIIGNNSCEILSKSPKKLLEI